MARRTKAAMEASVVEMREKELAMTKGNLLGAMEQVMEFSQKLERSQAEVFRKTIALQQANRGITRLHRQIDRMRYAYEVEMNSMKRNMAVAAKVIHAAEQGKLEAGSNPEEAFRFRGAREALEFARMLATGGRG